MTLRLPDVLSASRLALAAPFALAVVHQRSLVVAACLAWAAVSDVVDGRAARARGAATARGRGGRPGARRGSPRRARDQRGRANTWAQ